MAPSISRGRVCDGDALGEAPSRVCGVERSTEALNCAKSLDRRGVGERMERGAEGVELRPICRGCVFSDGRFDV
jgi:hypothetical protein